MEKQQTVSTIDASGLPESVRGDIDLIKKRAADLANEGKLEEAKEQMKVVSRIRTAARAIKYDK